MSLQKSKVKSSESTNDLVPKNDTRVAFDSPVAEINSLHDQIRESMIDAGNVFIRNAIQIGKLLSDIKLNLPHGNFKIWIDENVKFSMRMAQRYMKIYQNRDAIESHGFGSIRQAIGFLTNTNPVEPISDFSNKDLKLKFKKAFEKKDLSILNSKEKHKIALVLAEREKTLEDRIQKLKESMKEIKKRKNFLGNT